MRGREREREGERGRETERKGLQLALSDNFQISDVLSALSLASSVVVPNYGWVIFGGNSLTTTQNLQTLSGNWTAGPNLYQDTRDSSNCVVQVPNFF